MITFKVFHQKNPNDQPTNYFQTFKHSVWFPDMKAVTSSWNSLFVTAYSIILT